MEYFKERLKYKADAIYLEGLKRYIRYIHNFKYRNEEYIWII